MLSLQIIDKREKKSKIKKWALEAYEDGNKSKSVLVYDLNLKSSAIANRFEKVAKLVNEMSKSVPEFVSWFLHLIKEYTKSNYNSEIILNELPTFKLMSKKYIDAKKLNMSNWVNKGKVSKTSIVFDETDTKLLLEACTIRKLYSIFSCDETLQPTENIDRIITSIIIKECVEYGTVDKIYQLIKARTYRNSLTDKYMWQTLKLTHLETPETHTLALFNNILNELITILDTDNNPIPFLVKIVDDSLKWLMASVYKYKVVYSGAFGDIYDRYSKRNALDVYCSNDVIGKVSKLGLDFIENEYLDNTDPFSKDQILTIHAKLDEIPYITPIMKVLTIPIASRILEIPITHLSNATPKHIMLLGCVIHHLLYDDLYPKYQKILELLISIENDFSTMSVGSTFKIKHNSSLTLITNNINNTNIFGFKSPTLKYNMISEICGILTSNRRELSSIITGRKNTNIMLQDLEEEIIKFFLNMYSHKFDDIFNNARKTIESYL